MNGISSRHGLKLDADPMATIVQRVTSLSVTEVASPGLLGWDSSSATLHKISRYGWRGLAVFDDDGEDADDEDDDFDRGNNCGWLWKLKM